MIKLGLARRGWLEGNFCLWMGVTCSDRLVLTVFGANEVEVRRLRLADGCDMEKTGHLQSLLE